MDPFFIITSSQSFKRYYHKLKKEDLILTRLPLKKEDFPLIIDLLGRGVLSFPSFLSQILSKSKTAQAEILKDFMLPHTYVIRNKLALLEIMQNPPPFERFITKKDQANCGLGIHLWRDLEEIFNHAGTPLLEFPFVLQPFFEDWKDLRVIILGELYKEAYFRENPLNFRQNLFFGGRALPHDLTAEELSFCQEIMQRGNFPYAHLDLAYVSGKGPFLVEINLRGGIKGAKISTEAYERIVREIERAYLNNWKETHQPFEIL